MQTNESYLKKEKLKNETEGIWPSSKIIQSSLGLIINILGKKENYYCVEILLGNHDCSSFLYSC